MQCRAIIPAYVVSVWQNEQARSEEFEEGFEGMGESVNPFVRLGRLDWTKLRETFGSCKAVTF
jgi:hypothetical protein